MLPNGVAGTGITAHKRLLAKRARTRPVAGAA